MRAPFRRSDPQSIRRRELGLGHLIMSLAIRLGTPKNDWYVFNKLQLNSRSMGSSIEEYGINEDIFRPK